MKLLQWPTRIISVMIVVFVSASLRAAETDEGQFVAGSSQSEMGLKDSAPPNPGNVVSGMSSPNLQNTTIEIEQIRGVRHATIEIEPCVNCTSIPAVSDWGLAAMLLLMLSAGTLVMRRVRTSRPSQ